MELDFERPVVELEQKLHELRELEKTTGAGMQDAIEVLEAKIDYLRKTIYAGLTGWQRVQLSRHPARPYTLDYIQGMCSQFEELCGDRTGMDDKAIVGGLAQLGHHRVLVIGHQKGRDTKSRQYRNFGMANPEGYRKALRLMKLAEKFGLPVVTLIDTPGAHPGLHAEEHGQAEAIARNLLEMSRLKVPVICVVIGEGASGGALGIGVGNRLYMLENTWYSVISPESCSSILWRSWEHKEEAASALRLTAQDNLQQGIIDGIIAEPLGGAHRDPEAAIANVKAQLLADLDQLTAMTAEELVAQRMEKFASIGVVREAAHAH